MSTSGAGEPFVWAIVAAGGDGRRLGASVPKAFVPFRGRPLLAHAIELFEEHPAVVGMVLVVPAGWEQPASLMADELAAGKVAAAIAGGSTRSDSVAAGLTRVPAEAGVVVVHDAARPLASAALLSRVLAGLEPSAGAVPALPIGDTVKRVEAGVVRETLDRSALVTVQTPQAFRAAALRAGYAADPAAVAAATDCSALVEAAGFQVAAVAGDPVNIKITHPADVALAERAVPS